MPTYDLKCGRCGHLYERFLMRLLREEDKVCPVCGSHDVVVGVGGGYLKPAASSTGSACVSSGGFG